jgi:hypothetical protein
LRSGAHIGIDKAFVGGWAIAAVLAVEGLSEDRDALAADRLGTAEIGGCKSAPKWDPTRI